MEHMHFEEELPQYTFLEMIAIILELLPMHDTSVGLASLRGQMQPICSKPMHATSFMEVLQYHPHRLQCIGQ